jgi:acyl-coenzyme A synthetase/AMP-(fatty) acid ligase
MAAGRRCLVLNADHPRERNAEILRDARVYAAVTLKEDGDDASALPDGTIRIEFGTTAADCAHVTGSSSLGPDDPAIVLYTSGSSGQPKGIVLSQATILTRVRNNIVAMHLSRSDCFLSLGALGTTAGLVASMMALLGGSLQLMISVWAAGASKLLELIRGERVTIIWGVPALLPPPIRQRIAGVRGSLWRSPLRRLGAWRGAAGDLPSRNHLWADRGDHSAMVRTRFRRGQRDANRLFVAGA